MSGYSQFRWFLLASIVVALFVCVNSPAISWAGELEDAQEAEKKFQFEKAASHYKEIVKYDPETERFQEKLVRLLLRTDQLDEAVKAGQDALKRFPKNKAIHMNMGDILSSQGKVDPAIYHYEKVIQINPQNARATLLKGTILENQGKWDQAKDLYQQATKLEHNNPLGQFVPPLKSYLLHDVNLLTIKTECSPLSFHFLPLSVP